MGWQLLGGVVTRTVLHGMSFAGGLVLMAQGLDAVADLLVVAYPTFGWAEGRRFLARAGSAAEIEQFLRRSPEHAAEDVMVVLRYFDPINFAEWVRCPTPSDHLRRRRRSASAISMSPLVQNPCRGRAGLRTWQGPDLLSGPARGD